MVETPIRFGILGCAKVARKMCRALELAPNTTLYAIGSRSIETASRFSSDNFLPSSVKLYGSYEAVLDDPEVDAVYVPLPASLHLKWAVLAAEKNKHVLLEKPGASNIFELEKILEACESNSVQFMDATMWMHHPRTSKMKEFLDGERFGRLQFNHIVMMLNSDDKNAAPYLYSLLIGGIPMMKVFSSFSYKASPEFLENDIRMKPDLTAQGAVGDLGWYCIRAILWANNYELPKTVVANRNPSMNKSGVILSCGSSFYWEDGRVANFYCSYLTDITMDITAFGSNGSIRLHDFVVPFQENDARYFQASNSKFINLSTGCEPALSEKVVRADLPQEALMVQEFANLVANVKADGLKIGKKWADICRKTQVIVDAVYNSIVRGFEPVEITC